MQVFDGILYNGEDDVLECRLYELADYVDKFIIIEGDKSFTGIPRERKSREKFEQWQDKIHWVDYETTVHPNAWDSEADARNQIFTVAEKLGIQDDDVITVADTDEIWSPSMIGSFSDAWHGVMMRHLVFSVHWEAPMELTCIGGPWRFRNGTADVMRRQMRYNFYRLHGGWHLGWMGGPERCINKIKQFSHQELNVGNVEETISRCFKEGVFLDRGVLHEVEISADWPKWIRDGKHPASWVWRR